MRGRILVTGASVAGNALAWWLARHGFAVSVVERAPGFRGGGQNVDVRGSGREVMRRMGLETTLALVGAYVLAGELARGGAGIGADGIGTASAAYERVMRPLVARVQGVPKIGPRLFHPRSAAGVRALRATLRVAGDRRVQAVVKRFSGGGDRDPPLPEYEGLAASDGWRSRR